MKHICRLLSIGCLLGAQIAAVPALSAIPRESRQWMFTNKPDFSKGMNASVIQPVESLRDFKSDDIARMIPRDLTPSSDGLQVAARILDHSVSNFLNSEAVRNSQIGRTALEVEQTMDGNIAIGGDEPDSIKHSFKFKMRASQTKAKIEYTGLTNAELSYQIAQERFNFEIHENIGERSQLVFNHMTSSDDQVDTLSLRWVW